MDTSGVETAGGAGGCWAEGACAVALIADTAMVSSRILATLDTDLMIASWFLCVLNL